MKIFFVGLPGSGKSTLGKSVALALKIPFLDLDEEIENHEGERIAILFANKGEDYFRRVESEMLQKWCSDEANFLMATGGGTPCFNANMELINKTGVSVFLDASVETIAKRMLKTELASRPLLANQNVDTILNHVTNMRNDRLPFYRRAKLILSDEEVTEEKIIKAILDLEGETDRN